MFHGQLDAGKGYGKLKSVISVHFLFFSLFKEPAHSAYHHVFRARADEDDAILSPHFEIHTLEMTKFPDILDGDEDSKWLFYLKHGHDMTTEEVAHLGVPEIVEADRKLAMISQDSLLRAEFLRRKMAHHDAVSLREDSLEEGKAEGLLEGKREGLLEGKREGKREGLREGELKGERKTKINATLAILKMRGLPMHPDEEQRIQSCEDLDLLERWLLRAVTASSLAELFASEELTAR